MPPKKKRVTQLPPSKMSTRSSGKMRVSPSFDKIVIKTQMRASPKQVKKIVTQKTTSTVTDTGESISSSKENTDIEDMLSKLESDEGLSEPLPIEQVFIKMDDVDNMNEEVETSALTDGLENLSVDEQPAVSHVDDYDGAGIEEKVENSKNLEEQVVEIDSCDDFAVEYITEEFVPTIESSEVVIQEENHISSVPKVEETTNLEAIVLQPEEKEQTAIEEIINEVAEKEELTNVVNDEGSTELNLEEIAVEKVPEEKVASPSVDDVNAKEDIPVICENIAENVTMEIDDKPKEETENIVEVPPEVQPKEVEKVVTQPQKSKKKVTKREPKKSLPKKKTKAAEAKKDKGKFITEEVRRSSRIKSISVTKQRSKGRGVVKPNKSDGEATECVSMLPTDDEKSDMPVVSKNDVENKPVKVKSRWRKSCELEMNVLTPSAVVEPTCGDSEKFSEINSGLEDKLKTKKDEEEVGMRLKQFIHLKDNLYLTDRMGCKEAKKMICDCFLTNEEIERGELGCGDDCLNRLLMIECGNLCPVGERCTNKKFQKTQFAPVEVFKTEKKGLGLRAAANIPYGEFILEYVGEVLDPDEFDSRADDYSNDKNLHYYFMSLRADAIIDATLKGNISRFINHSCDPNAETQKWTVNGELRIGFFSTRTILAGEEVTFDYRFQRYGKEAQKCYCEASTCRGWLGEEPDDDEDDEEEDEEEEEEEEETEQSAHEKISKEVDEEKEKMETDEVGLSKIEEVKVKKTPPKEKKKRAPRKKPIKEIFEDLDQFVEEIEMLITTGLKNQAHTLKLSRLMVRAKEPTQRAKLLRVLRRGELPCRRLFLDYHGLRLMHGYMTDAQDLLRNDKKYESLRLELLQTLATLPIPNKTMLQDSKVLPTVEKWSINKGADLDSDSSPPQIEHDQPPTDDKKPDIVKSVESKPETTITPEEDAEIRKSVGMDFQGDTLNTSFSSTHGQDLANEIYNDFAEDVDGTTDTKQSKPVEVKSEERNYEEEITALALKLLEEWSNLKEVFKIPKKERIEQMKEHEREANRDYIAGIGLEQDSEKKNESRYRILKRYRSLDKNDLLNNRKTMKSDDRNLNNFPKLGKYERRKMFALQVEQREEERRRKQREMWRQHEQHCILLGTDPRLTAPFDPNRGYQCIWNPQIGQWQNYPIQNPNMIFNTPNPPVMSAINVQSPTPNYPFLQPPLRNNMVPGAAMQPLPSLPYQEEIKKEEVKFLGPIPPPAKLPPKWKCAKDKYERPYYYHIKIRKSQWEPPPLEETPEDPEEASETTSSSDTSSISSDSTSNDSDSDDELDDSRLLMQVKKQMEKHSKFSLPLKSIQKLITTEEEEEASNSINLEKKEQLPEKSHSGEGTVSTDVKDAQTVEAKMLDIFKEDKAQPSPLSAGNKKRKGLVSEIIISPRTEEDRLQFREDVKRYKMNKEKLKKEKELILQQSKKHTKEKRNKTTTKLKVKEMADANSESAKKIREAFRSNMATVVVAVLNAYRKSDCKEGRITNTDDFKHLARKLTHFVMLKEMKHIDKIEDLVCTENVKGKAREYIRKYMGKFGETYQKRQDEPDY